MGKVSFCSTENALKFMLVMVAQLCEYTKRLWIVHLIGLILLYDKYLNKAIKICLVFDNNSIECIIQFEEKWYLDNIGSSDQ